MTAEEDALQNLSNELDGIEDEQNPITDDELLPTEFVPVDVCLSGEMQLRVYVDQTYQAILDTNNCQHPTIFQKSGNMVRIMKRGNGSRIIQDMDYDLLFNALTYRVNFFHLPTQEEIDQWHLVHTDDPDNHPKNPPVAIVKNILSRNSYDGLPELIGIVTCPIMDLYTGNIRLDSHYDPLSKMYFGNIDLDMPPVPDNPTVEETLAAYNILKEVIIDFPFVSTANQTNMIALLITAVIRPSIEGHIPVFLIDKPAAGTGAGLLCDTVSIVVTGDGANIFTLPKNGEEEWKKVISTVLKSGNLLSIVDNVEDKINLPSLAALVTCNQYSDRLLGGNVMFTAPHRQTWIINGNNVQLGGDIARRVVWIRMDAELERPWLRAEKSFKHNQIPFVTCNRGEILSAIYTIVRSWVRAGRVMADDAVPSMGGFEAWRNTLGGIMQHLGCTEFLGNSQELIETTDVDAPQWNTFISTLFEKLCNWNDDSYTMSGGDYCRIAKTTNVEFITSTVMDILEYEKNPINIKSMVALKDVLPDELADEYAGSKNFNRVFGRSLRKNMDKRFGEKYRLCKSTKKVHQAVCWEIQKI
jgi:hypothetical protein